MSNIETDEYKVIYKIASNMVSNILFNIEFNSGLWNPIEGSIKKRRISKINTKFAKKRADHRNAILKDWAERLELTIEPKIPENYISPFDKDKCVYCLSHKIGASGDEFRPSTQRGRQNK